MGSESSILEYTKNISKYIQDIQRYTKIYKIPSGGGAAPPGPAPRRPGPDRGPVYLGISLYILGGLGSNFDEATNETVPYI